MPLVFFLQHALQFAFVVNQMILNVFVVDVVNDRLVVFDTHHLEMSEHVEVSVERQSLDHLKDVFVLIVLVDVDLTTVRLSAHLGDVVVFNQLLVCEKFVLKWLIKGVKDQLIRTVVKIDVLCFVRVVYYSKIFQSENIILHLVNEEINSLLLQITSVYFQRVDHTGQSIDG